MNGAVVEPAAAVVPIDDHGLVVGDGVFETIRTERGEPLALTRHLRRLAAGLEALSIPLPDFGSVRRGIDECLAAHFAAAPVGEARIRLTITGGGGSLGSGAPGGPPNVIVAVTPLGSAVAPSAITVPWTRNEGGALTGFKTTSYGENVRALRAAHDAGAGEAIFPNNRGELCEGTGTNVFVVIDGRCHTPPLSSGCLAGVTRELVVEVADVAETDLAIEVLASADEVFLTSTTRDVQGLTRIDDRGLEVGPVTESVARRFADLIAKTTDP